ncbi:type VI secretion protein [Streptomyces somaliensis DSM 40738]|uniref:Type VI secretion protein n=1 Tax=Streptomyces somaliensis (strain ATCC 33201 / DSM 40738 / JCM 12659 / KCTC 9044 / NCTC 11332 / NRRL B-12077 / IP 733) TaxID=1134445 RepID=A0AA44IBV9_STRE0|nr:type VI secretion protein [Streptomyces somaliensis]MCQ0023399.1 type VI secretion protein [Streptomyces somaliensis DSM 40738]NKY12772.1 type VI secretion protein [Streptomyces somaliensis DSM 40738]
MNGTPDARGGGRGGAAERGIPDGLLLTLLGLLLGVTLVAWTATGLAGLFTHGSWPRGATFARTPLALRHLLTDPQDLAGAWPLTPANQLPAPGVFWGLLIGELMVAAVLAVFLVGTVARWRAVRAAARARRGHPGATAATTGAAVAAPDRAAAPPSAPAPGPEGTSPKAPVHAPVHPPAYEPPHAPGHPVGDALGHLVREPVPAPRTAPPKAAPSATAPPLTAHSGTPHPSTPHSSTAHSGAQGVAVPPGAVLPAPTVLPVARPAPPRLVLGDRAARRPHALRAVLDAEGPALVVTSDPTLWADTKDARAKLGPVAVYDPGHLCDTPARLHWSPADGCEDTATAASRAAALLAPVRPRARVDAAVADTAETLLRCWLHAAAVDGRPFKQVHRWAQHHGAAHEPVRILRTHPKATNSHAGLLESALTAHPERRDAARALTARALGALSLVHVREACTPHRTDALVLESFAAEWGTLYVVGEPIEDPRTDPGAMPLLTALTSHVVEHGRRMAARSSDGRLDPPMTLVLDDVAAVAPLPRLPELLATGHDRGLPTLALLRSREQARARWQEPLTAPAP